MRISAIPAFAALLLAAPAPALAEGGLVDQVEWLEVEEGEAEFEIQSVYADAEDGHALLLNTTFAFGLSDRFQLGIELESERDDTGEALTLESINLQFKWIPLDPEDSAIGLGLQSSAAIDPDSGKIGSETFFIAESHPGAYDLAANLVLETEPGDWSEAETSYALRADHGLAGGIAIGIEAGGALSGEASGSHFLGPVLTVPLGEEGPALEFGVFAPLSEDAPDIQFRLEADFEF